MKWSTDSAHSSIEFSVRHMGIATVRGRFRDFAASAELDEQGNLEGITATIRADSVDTGVPDRDAHLRSPDFFDAERFPTIEFRATSIETLGDENYRVTGDLTMRGRTHAITLELRRADEINDPWGNRRIAGTLTGALNRKKWGLTWNQALEFGGLLVGEEVNLTIDVQVVASQAVEAAV